MKATTASFMFLLVLQGSSCLCQAQSPPRLTQQPRRSIYYFEDWKGAATFTLPCIASGSPPISYRWERNGMTVNSTSTVTIMAGELMARGARETDAGNYTCFASNEHGTAVSNTARVEYSYLRTFQDDAQSYPVNQGDALEVPCEAPPSHPAPIITWTKDDQPVFANGSVWNPQRNLVQDNEGALVFLQVSPTDNAGYRCFARAPVFPEFGTYSHQKTVSVQRREIAERPPMILQCPQVVKALSGDDVKMFCLATGDPLPTVIWTRAQDQAFSAQGPVLSLKNVQLAQNDTYTCTATSSSGEDVATTNLHVEAAPYWIVEPRDTTIYEGDLMTCEAGGEPAPVNKWMKNGQHIPTYDGRLSIPVTALAVYQCLAANVHGQIIANAILNVTAAPLPVPSNVDATRDSDSVTVQWSLLAPKGVIGYKVVYWPEGESEDTATVQVVNDPKTDHITIHGLQDTTYYVRVKGYGSEGDGLASDMLEVRDREQNLPRGAACTIPQSVLLLHFTLLVTFHLL